MTPDRKLEWDWYPGTVPENVAIDDTAYVETTFSFHSFRSTLPRAVEYGRGASTYLGTMFDVGPSGHVKLGDYALVHGARIICDAEVLIGDYALISWNVVLMDTYRLPQNPMERRRELELVPTRQPRFLSGHAPRFNDSTIQQSTINSPTITQAGGRAQSGRALAPVDAKPIHIGRNVWIGFDACVLPGVTIGEGSIIGAKSVVNADVPPFTIVAGNPSRVIRQIPNNERDA